MTMAPINDCDGGWVALLARQSACVDNKPRPRSTSNAKRKVRGGGSSADNNINNCDGDGGNATTSTPSLTKAQRIERREQKRIHREERRRLAEESRRHRLAKKRQKSNRPPSDSTAVAMSSSGAKNRGHEKSVTRGTTTPSSKKALTQLSADLVSTISSHAPQSTTAATPRSKRDKNKQDITTNGLPAVEANGKATKRSTLRPDSKELQPRKRDYNGQGLVRPTLFLPFDDPSFVPKLELEFGEHIPGFFGKAKQKAAKKQADENMLWKRCLKAKEEEGEGITEDESGGSIRGKRKKKKGVRLDERVEGMIRKGIV